jgi:hypothetical protein
MLLRLFSALALFVSATSTIKDCDSTSVFRPVSLGLSPDPPVRGAPVYMTVEFENPGPIITDATVTTAVSLNYIPLTPSTKSLCEDTECPIATGFNNRSTASTWPDTVSGKISSKITWTDPTGHSLLCIQLTANVAKISNSTALVPYYRMLHGSAPAPAPKHSDKLTPKHSDKPAPEPKHKHHKKAKHTEAPTSSNTASGTTGANPSPILEGPTINVKAIFNTFLNKITGSSGTSDSNSESQESHPTYTLRRVGGRQRRSKPAQGAHH